MCLPAGWRFAPAGPTPACGTSAIPAIAAVAAVVLDRDDRGKIVSAGLGYRVEGTAWRLGRHSRPDNVAACRQDLCGPDTLAAFYRKSAIESVGGFSPWAGDALAGIDLALALRQAGFRCALEPQCVAHVGAAATGCRAGVPATAAMPNGSFGGGRRARVGWLRWPATSRCWPACASSVFGVLRGSSSWPAGLCGAIQACSPDGAPSRPNAMSVEKPSVVAAPHFAVAAASAQRQRSSRVA